MSEKERRALAKGPLMASSRFFTKEEVKHFKIAELQKIYLELRKREDELRQKNPLIGGCCNSAQCDEAERWADVVGERIDELSK